MRRPATFTETLQSYEITYTPGDLRFTATGAKIGSERDDAIRMLVESWRLTEPQLQDMFMRIMHTEGMSNELNKSVEKNAIEMWSESFPSEGFHEALDQKHANSLVRDAQAGALILLLNDLLGGFQRNLRPGEHAWESAGPLISQRSVGIIVEAGANSFRHYDEWRHAWNKRKRFRPQQLKSIDVIADVLHVERIKAAKNASFELLFALSRGYWDNLARRLLRYAQAVADFK